MKRLQITVAYNNSVSHLLNKIIIIPAYIAREKRIDDGEAGVLSENEEIIKVNYRGSLIELPKEIIRVVEA